MINEVLRKCLNAEHVDRDILHICLDFAADRVQAESCKIEADDCFDSLDLMDLHLTQASDAFFVGKLVESRDHLRKFWGSV